MMLDKGEGDAGEVVSFDQEEEMNEMMVSCGDSKKHKMGRWAWVNGIVILEREQEELVERTDGVGGDVQGKLVSSNGGKQLENGEEMCMLKMFVVGRKISS